MDWPSVCAAATLDASVKRPGLHHVQTGLSALGQGKLRTGICLTECKRDRRGRILVRNRRPMLDDGRVGGKSGASAAAGAVSKGVREISRNDRA